MYVVNYSIHNINDILNTIGINTYQYLHLYKY